MSNLPVRYEGPEEWRSAQHSGDIGNHILNLGDARVYDRAIALPVGMWPLRGSSWAVVHQPMTVRKTATWAIVFAVLSVVLAVVGMPFTCGLSTFFLLGLLFLTVKETVVEGPMIIAIHSGRHHYNVQEYVKCVEGVSQVIQRVNYVQMLASR